MDVTELVRLTLLGFKFGLAWTRFHETRILQEDSKYDNED